VTQVFAVQGEHPHSPYWPLEVFASEASAVARCVELTTEFLTDWWEIHRDDEPPVVTADNWSEIVEEYGDLDEEVQDDGFGRWWTGMQPLEVKP
jgi:hypothetical protein